MQVDLYYLIFDIMCYIVIINRNQVFDILLEWVKHRDWEQALYAVMPKRKFNQTSKRKGTISHSEEGAPENINGAVVDSETGPVTEQTTSAVATEPEWS